MSKVKSIHYLLFSLFFTLHAIVSIAQRPLTAHVKGTECNMVYFFQVVGVEQRVDSAIISNQQFIIPGDYQPNALYAFHFKGVDKPEQRIILHPTASLRFNEQYDWVPSSEDSVNYRYLQFRTKHQSFYEKIESLSYETESRSEQDSLYKERARVYYGYIDSFRKELTTHRANPAAATALYSLIVGDKLQPPTAIRELYTLLAEPILDSYYGRKVGEYLNHEQQVSTGSVAPAFRLPASSGKLVSLTQFKGSYVLINFWASWCGPCRAKNRLLSQTMPKSNIQLLNISLDTDKQKWLEAILKDKLPGLNVSDLRGFKSPVAQAYNISGAPVSFLISPQGVIVGRDLSTDEIKKMIN